MRLTTRRARFNSKAPAAPTCRRATLAALAFAFAPLLQAADPAESAAGGPPPNLVIVFADDLGWGDLACFGHPTIRTPELDRMAREGMRLTQFYSAAPVCTPSRAALLTGRLPARNGMCSDRRRVLFPDSKKGLPAAEITIAEVLREQGYATACIGKWHLGHRPGYLPTTQGFDRYFGIPYSNDMDRDAAAPKGRDAFLNPQAAFWNVPLLRGVEIIERPAQQDTITRRYTEEAVQFINENRERPFFLYLPHNLPHVPLFRSAEFAGRSRRGLYGDVIEEIDWSVGQILHTLREVRLDRRTLVVFTSDNGPWLTFGDHGGSAGPLRGGKGSTWEGGMREPCVAWWPGRVPSGAISHELASTLDLLATACALSGAALPQDRILDSIDMTPILEGGAGNRDSFFYYRGYQLMAARVGPWKAHWKTQDGYGQREPVTHDPPLLFQLEHDISEQRNVAASHGDVLSEIAARVRRHQQGWQPAESQLED